MKYAGMPFGMWTLFAPSFRNQLTAVFGYSTNTAKAITKKAKPKYKAIILNRSAFSNSGRSAMIALYFGFAFFVMAFAVFVL